MPRPPLDRRDVVVGAFLLAICVAVELVLVTAQANSVARSVLVPRLVGLEQSDAKRLLRGDGLRYRVTDQPRESPALPRVGEVLAETPAAGTRVVQGTTVQIIVHLAPRSTATITGALLRVGGVAPGTPVGVRGNVVATKVRTAATFDARTTRAGIFTISVPAGMYRLSGRSPLINNGRTVGVAEASVDARAGSTARANVYFQVK